MTRRRRFGRSRDLTKCEQIPLVARVVSRPRAAAKVYFISDGKPDQEGRELRYYNVMDSRQSLIRPPEICAASRAVSVLQQVIFNNFYLPYMTQYLQQ